MVGHLTTWRLREGDGAQLVRDLTAYVAPTMEREGGLLTGFAVQTGPDAMVTLLVYHNAEEAEAAARAAAATLGEVVGDRAEVVAHEVGEAYVIWNP